MNQGPEPNPERNSLPRIQPFSTNRSIQEFAAGLPRQSRVDMARIQPQAHRDLQRIHQQIDVQKLMADSLAQMRQVVSGPNIAKMIRNSLKGLHRVAGEALKAAGEGLTRAYEQAQASEIWLL